MKKREAIAAGEKITERSSPASGKGYTAESVWVASKRNPLSKQSINNHRQPAVKPPTAVAAFARVGAYVARGSGWFLG